MLTEIGVCAVVLFFLFLWSTTRPKGMPPGPKPLPIIGNLLDVIKWSSKNQAQIEFAKIGHKYGGIFTYDIPGERSVVINSSAIAREALLTRKDDFSGRPYKFTWDYLSHGSKDIAIGDFSPVLIFQRKLVHSAMRMYNPLLEETLVLEANALCDRLRSYGGEPKDLENDIFLTTLNVICAIVYGQRYEINDPEFLMIVDYNKKMFVFLGPIHVLNVLPFLINFPIQDSINIEQVRKNRDNLLGTKLREHKATYKDGVIRDLTDALLKSLKEAEQEDSEVKKIVAQESYMIMTMADTFSGGLETTMTTMRWFIVYMMNYPEVQRQIHQELDDVMGDVMPRVEDKGRLHYLQAAIAETLRVCAVASLAVPHKACVDSNLAGYKIPKGTTLLFNIWAMHHDEKEWERPDVFDPTRFLDDKGRFSTARDLSYLPFGAGRRVCIGEALAKQELFIVLSRLMQQFRFDVPEGSSPPKMLGDLGLVHVAEPYKVCVRER